jgi:hypothetical protein
MPHAVRSSRQEEAQAAIQPWDLHHWLAKRERSDKKGVIRAEVGTYAGGLRMSDMHMSWW